MTALGLATQHPFGGCFNRRRTDTIKLCDRAQNFAAMPQQNAELPEILLCQIADDREVDGVVGEALGVLSQAELFKPVRDLLHRDPCHRLTALSTKAREYPKNSPRVRRWTNQSEQLLRVMCVDPRAVQTVRRPRSVVGQNR